MDYQTLQDLYIREIRCLQHAERQLLCGLPPMIRHATSLPLRRVLEAQLGETRKRTGRLRQISDRHPCHALAAKCRAMEGILEECRNWLSSDAGPAVLDVGILSITRHLIQYGIQQYGCASTHARRLGFGEDEGLLTRTLREEKVTARTLFSLGEAVELRALAGNGHAVP